jgi:uncharacterized protein YkwD
MHWALILSFAMLAGDPAQPAKKPALTSAAVQSTQPTPKLLKTALPANSPARSEDPAAESRILELANQSRRQAGLSPLRMDESLSVAAREHARLMVETEQLAHQFAGEPALLQRIAQASPLRLDRAGENVAYNSSAERAQQALMLSPPHRRNLLDPTFNVAGIAALWSEGRLYVVQDFGREVPTYSTQQTSKLVGQAINNVRRRSGLPQLEQITEQNLDSTVCELAQDSRVTARALSGSAGSHGVVTYSQSRPEILPQGALRLLADGDARQFAVGTCYARNASNPGGMYWVAILLY